MRAFIGVLGCILIVALLWDGFETMILPRRATRRFRLTAAFFRVTWAPWRTVVLRIRNRRRRETYLGYYGPLSMLMLLGVWAVGMVLGFGMLQWGLGSAVRAPVAHPGFGMDLYLSGTTFFTLGLGDVIPRTPVTRAITVIEAGLGFGFLAMVIGYFPVLYGAFSRREVNISMLDARAGSPSSAGELLIRFDRRHEELDGALRDLERWTAELLESHISYPVLSHFRSQHDNQSWLAAVTTVLDACALLLSAPEADSRQAGLTFAMARHAVVDLAQILRTAPRPPAPDRLPEETWRQLRQALAAAGIGLSGAASRARLDELRALYEPYVSALAAYLAMRLPSWMPEGRVRHNWETTAWARRPVLRRGPAIDGEL
jgi:hypothetical protein